MFHSPNRLNASAAQRPLLFPIIRRTSFEKDVYCVEKLEYARHLRLLEANAPIEQVCSLRRQVARVGHTTPYITPVVRIASQVAVPKDSGKHINVLDAKIEYAEPRPSQGLGDTPDETLEHVTTGIRQCIVC